MIIALKSLANGKFVCADDSGNQPLVANRDQAAGWESFEVFRVLASGELVPFGPLDPPPVPPPPVPTSPREWFMAQVAGKPFGQHTLLDLETTLNRNGWLLTPPNAVGDRTKVHPPGGPWTRVGFGEGKWVWIEQDQR